MATTENIAVHRGETFDEIFGEITPGVRVEIDEKFGHVDLIWVESLAFHLETRPEEMARLTNADGFLTHDGVQILLATLRALLPRAEIFHEPGEEGDEPSLGITVRIPTPKGESTTINELNDLVWPFYATLHNITDPGTFNSPYLITTAVSLADEATGPGQPAA